MKQIAWGRFFRRACALFLAAATVDALLSDGDAGAFSGGLDALGNNEAFVTAALQTELGPPRKDSLSFWERLTVNQSPLLAANPVGSPGSEPTQQPPLPIVSAAPTPEPPPETPVPTTAPLPDAQPAPDRDDLTTEEEPVTTTAPENIIERTLVPSSSQGYVTGAGLYLYNRTNLSVDLTEAVRQPLNITLESADQGPQILILHSHATEAYTPDGTDVYTPSDNNTRTLEESYNMLRIGDEMERIFHEQGLSVLHDRGIYDYPKYNGSYTRSGASIQQYLQQYPTIRLVLDVHRDALAGSDGTVYKAVTTIDGVKTAQVMIVVGSNAGGGDHPNWRENLALAAKLQKGLDALYPTLARPIAFRSSVYNQNLSTGALLVEVGSHGNTLQEALSGARLFARAAGQVFLDLKS